MHRGLIRTWCALSLLVGCAERFEPPVTAGKDLRLTILHTSDIHSRLLPYDMTVLAGDRALGLQQENAPFGGIARVAHVIERERMRAARSIYVDSGDCFQGAPIFNAFLGEVEQQAMTQLRPDAVVIGNHEFDEGIRNYVTQLERWAAYPILAANYLFEPGEPLGELARPVEVLNADGMIIGIIGVANFSSISSITDIGNSLNLVPLDIHQAVQDWIDILSPHVDLIVAVSHGGLTEDQEMIANTVGLDVVMGGHLHVVLSPPKVIEDAAGRPVVLAHSGAFAKFVGRLDLVVRDGDVIAHDYEVFAIDATIPEDPGMVDLIEPYRKKLHQLIDLDSVYGYASKLIRRFGFGGGDSPLGNLVSEAIRQYARSDFAMTNSLGIRTDLNPGAITLDQLFNIFPFNNYVTTMYLSGADVQQLLDFASRRSAGRGCATQIQVSGIEFVMDCNAPSDACPDCPRAREIFLTDCGDPSTVGTDCTRTPLDHNAVYEMATNDYIAQGGSGFTVLKVNNTQTTTDVALRDAVLEVVLRSTLCVEECRGEDGSLTLEGCSGYETCAADLADFYVRRCRRVAETTPDETTLTDRCPLDLGGSCKGVSDCWAAQLCDDGACQACEADDVCGDGGSCVSGWCRPARLVCDQGRCSWSCSGDGDCPGDSLLDGAAQSSCVSGLCLPRPGAPCVDDGGCVDAEAQCAGGGCAACDEENPCGDEALCDQGLCVVPTASCLDHRCRVRCTEDDHCLPGEACSATNHCRPLLCEGEADLETACELLGQWRALERCLTVPCPTAEADGRIQPDLPENIWDVDAERGDDQ